MEAIKTFISGGKSQENVADQTTGTTHGSALTGEGSHLGQSTHTGTGTTGQHNSSVLGSDSKTSPLTGNHSSGVGSTQSSGLTGEGTHFSTGHNQGLTGHNTTQSGLTNTEGAQLGHATGHNHGLTSGTTHPSGVTGSHNTTTGPHTHDISNRADPRVDSDNSKIGHSGLTGDHTSSGSGIGSNQHSGLPGTHHGSSTHDSSILPGHSTTGPHQTEAANRLDPNVSSGNSKIENAAHHHSEKRGGGAEEADQHHSSSGVGSTGFGSSGTGHSTTTAGPHDSNLLNKADPRIDSDRSKQSGIGHSTTSHHDNNDSHLGRDAALGAGAVGAAGHEHTKHQTTSASGIPSSGHNTTTAGPHSSDLLNKADPQVDSDRSKQSGTGLGTTSHHDNNNSHVGRDTALGAGAVGVAGREHEHTKHQTTSASGNLSSGHNTTTTAGPHSSDLLNKADPQVDSDRSKQSGTGLGTSSHHDKNNSHVGRDAALGAGAVGVAGREHEHTKHQTTGTSGLPTSGHSTTTAGPHDSNLLNRADPTVDSDRSKQTGAGHNTTSHHHDNSHVGRDAALGAGAVGVAGHEHNKHHETSHNQTISDHNKSNLSGTGHNTTSHSHNDKTTSDSHHARDTAIGTGVAGAATHEHTKNQKGDLPGPAPNTAGPHKHDILNKLDPRVHANPNTSQSTGSGPFKADSKDLPTHSNDHHHSKDAAAQNTSTTGHQGVGTGLGSTGASSHVTAGSRTSDPNAQPWQRDTHISEPHKGHGATPLVAKAPGTDLGDKLHGTERNRGVNSELKSGELNPAHHGTTSHDSTHTGTHGSSGLTGNHGTTSHDSTHTGTHGSSGLTGNHGTTGHDSTHTGTHGSSGLTGDTSTSGTHDSNVHSGQSNLTGHNNSGLTDHQTTTSGPHSSNLANKADSNLTDHQTTTSGPHSSDLATKANSSIDSDNSKIGGVRNTPQIHHVPQVGKHKEI